ncbi:helix-turn-helix domain-containing protein [Streptomyces olivoreticuli]
MSRKKQARKLMPGPERDKVAAELKARYDNGASVRAIAEATGRSRGGPQRQQTDAPDPGAGQPRPEGRGPSALPQESSRDA